MHLIGHVHLLLPFLTHLINTSLTSGHFPNSLKEARVTPLLKNISQWMSAHHLQLNLDKTELLFLQGKECPTLDLTITIGPSVVSPTQTARPLGVTLDNNLSFTANIAATTRCCRFTLYNIRRIRPLLTQKATQLLVQALIISRLDCCNSLLAGLPACAIRPLQLIQNAAARLVFNLPTFSHMSSPLKSGQHKAYTSSGSD